MKNYQIISAEKIKNLDPKHSVIIDVRSDMEHEGKGFYAITFIHHLIN